MKTSPSDQRDQELKMDAGKPRLELIPPSALISLGKVLTYGADKYGAHRWRQVYPDRYMGALLRHMAALMDGEDVDPESGLRHIEHVLCNAAFINDLTEGTHEQSMETRSKYRVDEGKEGLPNCKLNS